jgi:hypothetical protein
VITEFKAGASASKELQQAQDVSFAIRGSKTDQARLGCVRRLRRTDDPIDAVATIITMLGSRSNLTAATASDTLFELDSGRPVANTTITQELKDAAEEMGLESARYATHSLRRGGATALNAAGVNTEIIRRWGRWLSDCWKRYVFGTTEELGDMASAMVNSPYSLAMSVEDFKASV